MFAPRNDTAVAAFGEAGQGQLEAAWIEFGIFGDALAFMKEKDRARLGAAQDPA